MSLQNAMFITSMKPAELILSVQPQLDAIPTTDSPAASASLAYGRCVLPVGTLTSRRYLEQVGGRMILGHGIDVADLGRVRVLLAKMEDDFLHSTFTVTERETENLPEDRVPFFAGRLAAKEAVVKALGTGFTGGIAMRQVEIARLPDGSPEVRLRGAAKEAAESLGVGRWLVSISHTETVAIASAIAVKV